MNAVAPWLMMPAAMVRRAIIRAAFQQVQRSGWGPYLDVVEMTAAMLDCTADEVAEVVGSRRAA